MAMVWNFGNQLEGGYVFPTYLRGVILSASSALWAPVLTNDIYLSLPIISLGTVLAPAFIVAFTIFIFWEL